MKKVLCAVGIAATLVVPALANRSTAYALDAKGVANHARDILNRARAVEADSFGELANARRADEVASAAWHRAAYSLRQAGAMEIDAALILGDEKEAKAVGACFRAHNFQWSATILESRSLRFDAEAKAATNEEAYLREEIKRLTQRLNDATDPKVKAQIQDALNHVNAAAAKALADAQRDSQAAKDAMAASRKDIDEATKLKKTANDLFANSCK